MVCPTCGIDLPTGTIAYWKTRLIDEVSGITPEGYEEDLIDDELNILRRPLQTVETKLQPVTQGYLLCQPVVRDIIESFEMFGGDLNMYSDTFLTSQ